MSDLLLFYSPNFWTTSLAPSGYVQSTAVLRSVIRIDWLLDIPFKVILALACELSMYFHLCGG